jgi:hypothetical protein
MASREKATEEQGPQKLPELVRESDRFLKTNLHIANGVRAPFETTGLATSRIR